MALLSSAASPLFGSISGLRHSASNASQAGSNKSDGAAVESERPNFKQEFRQGVGVVPLQVYCVGSQVKPENTATLKRSKVEIIKENSNYLRYPLNEDLLTDAPNVSESSVQLIKFHGSYQQYDRDVKGSRNYSFMLRTKQPAGKVSNSLYLVMDSMADEFGIGSLRLTTRQTFQLHGVLKKNLKTVMSTIVRNMGSTLGACGDVNRNVLAPPAPYTDRKDYLVAQETAEKLAELLAPQGGAYYDVWVDGEKVLSAEHPDVTEARNTNINGSSFDNSPEPIYGSLFLPRKFKIAVTVPGDNSVDLFTNDIGIVTIFDNEGELEGYNIYVGGGMGRTHRNEETFARISEPLGYVPKEDILYAVKAIVATQRDYGRRDDRRQSRLKYLVHDWGIDKFRSVTEHYYGRTFHQIRELPPWKFESFLGWHDQGDKHLFYGIHIENGRITGDLKKTLRSVIEKYNLSVRLTANQNIVLCDIKPAWKSAINKALGAVGVKLPRSIDNLNLGAMACPALPLCPLAITEAERGAPDMLLTIREVLKKVGFPSKTSMIVRFTGCPNGCTRPYMAELGLVGDGPNAYQIWLGGNGNQTRLAQPFQDKVKVQNLGSSLEPLFYYWKTDREGEDEGFGDFTNRKGFSALRSYIESYEGIPRRKSAGPRIVNVSNDLYEALSKLAVEQQTTTSSVASKIIEEYVKSPVK